MENLQENFKKFIINEDSVVFKKGQIVFADLSRRQWQGRKRPDLVLYKSGSEYPTWISERLLTPFK
jgi:hypothetical protein